MIISARTKSADMKNSYRDFGICRLFLLSAFVSNSSNITAVYRIISIIYRGCILERISGRINSSQRHGFHGSLGPRIDPRGRTIIVIRDREPGSSFTSDRIVFSLALSRRSLGPLRRAWLPLALLQREQTLASVITHGLLRNM